MPSTSADTSQVCKTDSDANPASGAVNHSADDPRAGLIRILFATLLGLVVLLAWVGLPFEVPYIGYGLASAFVFQVAVRPRRWEIISVALGGCGLVLFDRLAMHHGRLQGLQLSTCFGMLGLVSFLVLGLKAVWAAGAERDELKSILIPAAGFAFFILASQNSLNLAGLLFPKTLDLYAYAFDGSLGFQPSFLLGQAFRRFALIDAVGHFTYYALPVAMALVYAAHLRRKAVSPLSILGVYFATGLAGYFLYLAFPAAGPAYVAGPSFPNSPLSLIALRQLTLRPVPLPWQIPRNAMPSLHIAWALIVWFNCRPFARWVRTLALVFVLVTVFDTLGTGEHYLIDLVVAFPFAVAMQALCMAAAVREPRQHRFIIGGCTTVVIVWLVLLRYATGFFLLTPVLPWTFVIASTAISAWAASSLMSGDERNMPGNTALARAASTGSD
jgi:hypothetical protein